ncbi:MAG: nucleotidyltransferase family protein [bacterium]
MNKEKLKSLIYTILQKYDIKKASYFGSITNGDFTDKSDIDILIEYSGNNKTLLDLIALKQELEEETHRKIDILTYKSINPKIAKQILEQQEIIYER